MLSHRGSSAETAQSAGSSRRTVRKRPPPSQSRLYVARHKASQGGPPGSRVFIRGRSSAIRTWGRVQRKDLSGQPWDKLPLSFLPQILDILAMRMSQLTGRQRGSLSQPIPDVASPETYPGVGASASLSKVTGSQEPPPPALEVPFLDGSAGVAWPPEASRWPRSAAPQC